MPDMQTAKYASLLLYSTLLKLLAVIGAVGGIINGMMSSWAYLHQPQGTPISVIKLVYLFAQGLFGGVLVAVFLLAVAALIPILVHIALNQQEQSEHSSGTVSLPSQDPEISEASEAE
ncbi:MAG: hypothetical protein KatS3mg130_1860 [Candidatus Sumerlaea sp.]|nr:MAG: hypothetical protein KatS3mg130_1860 [Candidatus Sumerlaea sp.]